MLALDVLVFQDELLARFVVNSHVKHHPSKQNEEGGDDDENEEEQTVIKGFNRSHGSVDPAFSFPR